MSALVAEDDVATLSAPPAKRVEAFFVLDPVAVVVVVGALLAHHHAQQRVTENAGSGFDLGADLVGKNTNRLQQHIRNATRLA